MKLLVSSVALAAAVVSAPASAAYVNVWSTSFDLSEYENVGPFPWGSLQTIYGGANFDSAGSTPGGGTRFFHSTTTALTSFSVFSLGAHDSLKLSFDLIFVDSWDSLNGSPAPDILTLVVDGSSYALTAANASGSIDDFGPGTLVTRSNFVGGGYNDALVHYDLTFAHVASNFNMSLQAGGAGWQGGTDESWAIDNFSLSAQPAVNPVPEPATWAMMIGGLGLAGAAMRRRKAAVRFA